MEKYLHVLRKLFLQIPFPFPINIVGDFSEPIVMVSRREIINNDCDLKKESKIGIVLKGPVQC